MAIDMDSMAAAVRSGTLVFDRAQVLLTYPSVADGTQIQTSIEEIAGGLAAFIEDLKRRHNRLVDLVAGVGVLEVSPDGSRRYVGEDKVSSPMSY